LSKGNFEQLTIPREAIIIADVEAHLRTQGRDLTIHDGCNITLRHGHRDGERGREGREEGNGGLEAHFEELVLWVLKRLKCDERSEAFDSKEEVVKC